MPRTRSPRARPALSPQCSRLTSARSAASTLRHAFSRRRLAIIASARADEARGQLRLAREALDEDRTDRVRSHLAGIDRKLLSDEERLAVDQLDAEPRELRADRVAALSRKLG
jgi:hypothetical protein